MAGGCAAVGVADGCSCRGCSMHCCPAARWQLHIAPRFVHAPPLCMLRRACPPSILLPSPRAPSSKAPLPRPASSLNQHLSRLKEQSYLPHRFARTPPCCPHALTPAPPSHHLPAKPSSAHLRVPATTACSACHSLAPPNPLAAGRAAHPGHGCEHGAQRCPGRQSSAGPRAGRD